MDPIHLLKPFNNSKIKTVLIFWILLFSQNQIFALNSSNLSAGPIVNLPSPPPPGPIANPASNITNNSFRANWNAYATASVYILDVSTSSTFVAAQTTTYPNIPANTPYKDINGLLENTTYYYRVRAVNNSYTPPITSQNSLTITAITLATPPNATTATAASSLQAFSFNANWNSISGALEYELDVSLNIGFTSFVGVYKDFKVTSNMQNIAGLSSNTTYYYRIRVVSSSGTSANSNIISTKTLTSFIAPIVANASSVSDFSFVANWNPVPDGISYLIDVATDINFTNLLPPYINYPVVSNSLAITEGIACNKNYYYRVRAINNSGTSTNSATKTVLTALKTPVILPATDIEKDSFTVNWMLEPLATSYNLDVSTSPDFLNNLIPFENLTGTSQNIVGLNAGTTYYYRLKAINATNSSPYITRIQTTRGDSLKVFPPTTGILGQVSGYPITGSGIVGALPGSASVGGSGGASYSIPIEIPAGINGMQPNMAIVYNSQSGNGILGMGTGLSGLSSITRIPNNPYYDNGNYRAVAYDTNDKFALDGQRLFLTSSGNYGGDGTTYTTETDPTTIVTISATATEPTSFMVKTKNGTTLYFGSNMDAKIIPLGSPKIFGWLINKVEDANGNYMLYNYAEQNGSKVINEISYTGNGSNPTFYKLKFNYALRSDINFAYIGGYKLESTKLLQNIELFYTTTTTTTLLKKYTFSYTTDIVSRLNSISLENADGEHINPTLLYWDEKNGLAYNGQVTCESGVPGDFNNDGLGDLFAIVKTTGGTYYEQLFLNNKNGELVATPWKQEITANYKVFENILDFNGDGMADILDKDENGSYRRAKIGLSNGTSMSYLAANPYDQDYKSAVGDFDGNGRDEVLIFFVDGHATLLKFDNAILNELEINENSILDALKYPIIDKFYTGDFNGDGRIDLGYLDQAGIFKPFTLNGIDLSALPSHSNTFTEKYKFNTGDFNGDGATDLAKLDYANWKIYFNKGNVAYADPEIVSSAPVFEWGFGSLPAGMEYTICMLDFDAKVQDINMDGKADIVHTSWIKYTLKKTDLSAFNTADVLYIKALPNYNLQYNYAEFHGSSNVVVAYGKGDGTFVNSGKMSYDYTAEEDSPRNLIFMDINGDATLDVFMKEKLQYTAISPMHGHQGNKSYQLDKVVDGMNNSVQFIYQSLNNPVNPIYRPYSLDYASGVQKSAGDAPNYPSVFPVIDFTPSYMAVASIIRSNGASSNIIEKYSYVGAKMHLHGKGFLGFGEMTMENISTGMANFTRNSFDWDYMVYTNRMTARLKGTEVIGKVERNGSFLRFPYGRYIYKLDDETITDNLNSTVTNKYYTSDNFGNVLTDKTVTAIATSLVTNTYVAINSAIPNKLKTSTATVTRDASITRSQSFDYDAKGNLTQTIQDVADKNQVTTTYSGYNNFGNPDSISVTSNGITRSSSVDYSSNGRFVEKATDNFGKTTEFTYEPKWGAQTAIKDFKNRLVQNTFDNWGRVNKTKYADGKYSISALRWANGSGPANSAFYSYGESSGSAPVISWFDKSGKELRTQSKGFNAQDVYVDKQYDALGRAYKVSDPYYASSGPAFNLAEFDGYGRIVKQTLATGDQISTDYAPKVTTVIGPNSKSIQTVNELGEVIEITDDNAHQTVGYEYYPDGTLKSTKPSTGPAVAMEYDLQGNRTKITDPDAGPVTSEYNGFGELQWQIDAKGNRTEPTYNNKGLVTSVSRGTASTINYTYNADFQLTSVFDDVNTQTYVYDDFDRMIETTQAIDGKTFTSQVQYNTLGLPVKEIYPSKFAIKNHYDEFGMLIEITDSLGNRIWQLNSISALGQIGSVIKGNNKTTNYAYDAHHRPSKVETAGVAEFEYVFAGATGNLTSRRDIRRDLAETFAYDNLDRLTGAKIGTNENYLNLTYQDGGNILSKTDVGAYAYNNAIKVHALTDITNLPTPSNIPSLQQDVDYTAFNMVEKIKEGANELKFTYGIDNQRLKTQLYNGGILTKTKYFAANYEEVIIGSDTTRINYIAGGDGLAAVYIIDKDKIGKTYYTYSDHLGSIIALTNATGAIEQEQSFDPWGRKRNPNNWSYENIPSFTLLDRGYTGHEHLNEFGLINMNGRLYDPLLGRILSPDPLLQDPSNTQNFNRYSYCFNNPLKYTDPSGYLTSANFWAIVDDLWNRAGRNGSASWSSEGPSSNNIGNGEGGGDASGTGGVWGNGSSGSSSSGKDVKDMKSGFWATHIGKFLMRLAGYEPVGGRSFYQRFVRDGSNDAWSWESPLVIPIDQFVGNGTGNNCFDNARLQSGKVGVSPEGNSGNSFFIYFAGGYESANHGFGSGYTGPNNSSVIEAGEDYIINEIFNKRPVTVCVDYMDTKVNRDGGDHWLTIVSYGIDDKSDFYFRFFDNYTSNSEWGTSPLLRFYWSAENKAFQSRPEAYLFGPEFNDLNGVIYTITAIRRNKKKK